MTALPWLVESASPGDGLSIAQTALMLSAILIALLVFSHANLEAASDVQRRSASSGCGFGELFRRLRRRAGSGLHMCISLARVGPLDLDEPGSIRSVLNWSAIALAVVAVATVFV